MRQFRRQVKNQIDWCTLRLLPISPKPGKLIETFLNHDFGEGTIDKIWKQAHFSRLIWYFSVMQRHHGRQRIHRKTTSEHKFFSQEIKTLHRSRWHHLLYRRSAEAQSRHSHKILSLFSFKTWAIQRFVSVVYLKHSVVWVQWKPTQSAETKSKIISSDRESLRVIDSYELTWSRYSLQNTKKWLIK